MQLDSWDLKKWRKRLGYNQFEAAERLGVHRSAVQNWEREVRPVPLTVVLACEEIERKHQSLNQESVLLVCTDGPIVQPSNLLYTSATLRNAREQRNGYQNGMQLAARSNFDQLNDFFERRSPPMGTSRIAAGM